MNVLNCENISLIISAFDTLMVNWKSYNNLITLLKCKYRVPEIDFKIFASLSKFNLVVSLARRALL